MAPTRSSPPRRLGCCWRTAFWSSDHDPAEERTQRAAERHHAALRYARLHSLIYNRPWSHACPLGKELGITGSEPPDEVVARAQRLLAEMDARLTPEQRRAVANVGVFGFVPQWFYTARLGLRELPDDRAQRGALLSGLEALRGVNG